MRRPVLRAATALAVLVAAAGAVPAAEGDLVFEATLESAAVKLGEDVVVRLTAKNHSPKAIDVPKFRLAQDSVAVRVAWGGETRATVTRLWGTWVEEDPAIRFRPTPTSQQRVGPGETYAGTVTFSAVVAGDLTLVPIWGPEGDRRSAKPLTVEVGTKGGPPKKLVAEIATSQGTFTAELDGAAAFNSVSQFWRLARESFYDGLTIHRVEPGLLVQGGDPRGDGTGGPGWTLAAEGGGRPLARGLFALARGAHADSACCQFFAVSDAAGRAATALRAEFTPLGKVLEGQDVVDALASIECDPKSGRPKTPPTITAVRAVVR